MWGAIVGFFSSLPKLLDYVDKILAWVKEWIIERENAKRLKEMEKAVNEPKTPGDTSGIDDLLRNPNGKPPGGNPK